MKITLEGPETIQFIPESRHEEECLDALWKLVIRCDTDSKVLCPVGKYVPGEDDAASFVIEDRKFGGA